MFYFLGFTLHLRYVISARLIQHGECCLVVIDLRLRINPQSLNPAAFSHLCPPWAMRSKQRVVISSWVMMIWATAAVTRTAVTPVWRAEANRSPPDLLKHRAANEPPPSRCPNPTICSDLSANPRSSTTRWIKSSTGTEEPSKRQKRSVSHSLIIPLIYYMCDSTGITSTFSTMSYCIFTLSIKRPSKWYDLLESDWATPVWSPQSNFWGSFLKVLKQSNIASFPPLSYLLY